jgi:hypothetical protein
MEITGMAVAALFTFTMLLCWFLKIVASRGWWLILAFFGLIDFVDYLLRLIHSY